LAPPLVTEFWNDDRTRDTVFFDGFHSSSDGVTVGGTPWLRSSYTHAGLEATMLFQHVIVIAIASVALATPTVGFAQSERGTLGGFHEST
jgi:hypothetical protein